MMQGLVLEEVPIYIVFTFAIPLPPHISACYVHIFVEVLRTAWSGLDEFYSRGTYHTVFDVWMRHWNF